MLCAYKTTDGQETDFFYDTNGQLARVALPGSSYTDGVLQGAVLDLNEKKSKVAKYILVNG